MTTFPSMLPEIILCMISQSLIKLLLPQAFLQTYPNVSQAVATLENKPNGRVLFGQPVLDGTRNKTSST